MASLDTFLTAETVLRHGCMFQGSDEVQKPLLYDSARAIRIALTCLYSAVYLESFFYYNGVTTAEGTGFWTPEAYWT